MARNPVVHGRFYPAEPHGLKAMVEEFVSQAELPRAPAKGLLCPHAGYVFSGGVAGKTFGAVEVPDTVLVLSPSHNYDRPPLALWTGGDWLTPLGRVPMHEELTRALETIDGVTAEDRVHGPEHSGEVMMPFIQVCNPQARIAVICVTATAGQEALKAFGQALPDALREAGADDALVVASSDMSHEQGKGALDVVNEHDALVLEQMEAFSPEGVYDACKEHHVTMCGRLPAVAMMYSALARGASEAIHTGRATSADSPYGRGDYIVGYTGMVFR